jgi:hypothetical protein
MEFQRSGAGGLPSASPERAKCGKESVYWSVSSRVRATAECREGSPEDDELTDWEAA